MKKTLFAILNGLLEIPVSDNLSAALMAALSIIILNSRISLNISGSDKPCSPAIRFLSLPDFKDHADIASFKEERVSFDPTDLIFKKTSGKLERVASGRVAVLVPVV